MIDFIIAGVARSATTSLYHFLKDNTPANLSRIKEPKYFSRKAYRNSGNGKGDKLVASRVVDNFDDYLGLWSEEGSRGEASSDYFYHAGIVIKEIKALSFKPKIILILRNPINRTFSAYNNMVRDGREDLSFIDALRAEPKRIVEGYDWMWHYLSGSLYFKNLEKYLNEFDEVKVVLYENLVTNPEIVCNDIAHFLGFEVVKNGVFPEYSPGGRPNNIIAKILLMRYGVLGKIRTFLLRHFPRRYMEVILGTLIKRELIEEDARNFIIERTREDVKKLSKVIPEVKKLWKEYDFD